MTLNSSGPLSLGGSTPGESIALELGRVGTPISFSDSDVRALAEIPSGPISLSDFYGKSAGGGGGLTVVTPLVSRTWYKYWDWAGSPTSALTWVRFDGDGNIICFEGSAPTGPANVHTYDDRWYNPSTIMDGGAGYFVRATLLSGSPPNGGSDQALDTWYDLGVSVPSWTCKATISSSSTSITRSMSLLIEISTSASDVDIVTSGTYDMTSECAGNA